MRVPKGIQLRRTSGYRKPSGAIVVSRPSRWGNPYRVGENGVPDAAIAVALFEEWLLHSTSPIFACRFSRSFRFLQLKVYTIVTRENNCPQEVGTAYCRRGSHAGREKSGVFLSVHNLTEMHPYP